MVVTRFGTTQEGLEAHSSDIPTIESTNFPTSLGMTWGGNRVEVQRAVEYEGDTLVVNPELMRPGHFYPALFEGHPVVLLKCHDDSVEMYALLSPGG